MYTHFTLSSYSRDDYLKMRKQKFYITDNSFISKKFIAILKS